MPDRAEALLKMLAAAPSHSSALQVWMPVVYAWAEAKNPARAEKLLEEMQSTHLGLTNPTASMIMPVVHAW